MDAALGHRGHLAQGKIIECRPVAEHLILQVHADSNPRRPSRRPRALLQQDPIRPSSIGQSGR